MYRDKPVKYCEICGKAQIISREEFYAIFGKLPEEFLRATGRPRWTHDLN
jgi:hypothetical protein